MPSPDPAISRLADSTDPSITYLTLVELLDRSPDDPRVIGARRAIPRGKMVRGLLRDQRPNGGFGVHAYLKWTGGFWRLVALAELAMPPGGQRLRALAGHVLDWLEGSRRAGTSAPVAVGGLIRAHATQDGYALAAMSLLGLAGLPRVKRVADRLIDWQWPDGGWNCDRRPSAAHSSFHETHGALWGLAEFHRATGDRHARHATARAAEFLLRHRLLRSERSGRLISEEWLQLRWPPYWHYDILQGLWVLTRAGRVNDPRASEAIELLLQKRDADGMWRAQGYHWKPPGSSGSNVEVIDWGRRGPNEWLTLRVLRVLKSAGRLP